MLKQRKERSGDFGPDVQMTPRQMLLRIIEIVSGEGITEDKLEKILRAAETIAGEKIEN
ncbi:MAG TPA: hypothetical protein VGV87_16990 [Blastocatellia bacterium]|jgi:hypothetical protein|nr:hypothetical protein [Blastocatellia bacterium]